MIISFTIFLLEISWVKGVVKPILVTRKANDVGMHIWFIHSLLKIFKKM